MTCFSINLVRRPTVSGEYDSGGEEVPRQDVVGIGENRTMLDKWYRDAIAFAPLPALRYRYPACINMFNLVVPLSSEYSLLKQK